MIPAGSPTTLSVCVSPDALANIPALTFFCLTSSGIGQRGKTNTAPWHKLSLSPSTTGAGVTEPVSLGQKSTFHICTSMENGFYSVAPQTPIPTQYSLIQSTVQYIFQIALLNSCRFPFKKRKKEFKKKKRSASVIVIRFFFYIFFFLFFPFLFPRPAAGNRVAHKCRIWEVVTGVGVRIKDCCPWGIWIQ